MYRRDLRQEGMADPAEELQAHLQTAIIPPGGVEPTLENLTRVAPLPGPLLEWFVELALLKPLPLRYLVPTPEALPPESIRFFYLDPHWIESLVRGALEAGNLGVVDRHLSNLVFKAVMAQIWTEIRRRSQLIPTQETLISAFPVTGFLLRSAAVRRWPEMKVRAFRKAVEGEADQLPQLPILRRHRLGPSLLLVLFGGVPHRVELEEPAQGMQFGADLGTPMVTSVDLDGKAAGATSPASSGAQTGSSSNPTLSTFPASVKTQASSGFSASAAPATTASASTTSKAQAPSASSVSAPNASAATQGIPAPELDKFMVNIRNRFGEARCIQDGNDVKPITLRVHTRDGKMDGSSRTLVIGGTDSEAPIGYRERSLHAMMLPFNLLNWPRGTSSCQLALSLQQLPWCQVFQDH